MRPILLVLLLGLFPLAAMANDRAVVGIGGRVQALKFENPQIRMVKERVHMRVRPNEYEVTADFWFANEGPATSVLMGFPESGAGDIDSNDFHRQSGFTVFKSWVDGRSVSVTRRFDTGEEGYYRAHWVKSVGFSANQRRHVRVYYRAPVGSVALPGIVVEYPFTGGNWKGVVGKSRLEVDLELPASYQLEAGMSTPMCRQGQRLVFERRDWQAEESVMLYFLHTPPGPM